MSGGEVEAQQVAVGTAIVAVEGAGIFRPAPRRYVVTLPAIDVVVARAAVDPVGTFVTIEIIVAACAMEIVVSEVTAQRIGAAVAAQDVSVVGTIEAFDRNIGVAGCLAGIQRGVGQRCRHTRRRIVIGCRVVPEAAIEEVRAALADQPVVTRVAEQAVAVHRPAEALDRNVGVEGGKAGIEARIGERCCHAGRCSGVRRRVPATAAIQNVVSAVALKPVAAGIANQCIRVHGPEQRLDAGIGIAGRFAGVDGWVGERRRNAGCCLRIGSIIPASATFHVVTTQSAAQ